MAFKAKVALAALAGEETIWPADLRSIQIHASLPRKGRKPRKLRLTTSTDGQLMREKVRSRSIRRAMIDRDHQQLWCVNVSCWKHYRPVKGRRPGVDGPDGRQYLKTPFYGSRKMKAWLLQQGYLVSRKRVRRLMRLMGLEAICRRPNTSKPAPGHRIFPYLLKGVEVNRVDKVGRGHHLHPHEGLPVPGGHHAGAGTCWPGSFQHHGHQLLRGGVGGSPG